MADPKRSPLGLSVSNCFSPVSSVAEVRATAGLDQHVVGLAAQGAASIQWHVVWLKPDFREISKNHLQHSPKERGIRKFARRAMRPLEPASSL
jgi:hypothetical protein